MATKEFHSSHNDKKEKGTNKKSKQKTDYQRERDAAKARKKRSGNYAV